MSRSRRSSGHALTAKAAKVELHYFDRPTKAQQRAVAAAARRYSEFLGLPVDVG